MMDRIITDAVRAARGEGWIVYGFVTSLANGRLVRMFRVRPRGTKAGHAEERELTTLQLLEFTGRAPLRRNAAEVATIERAKGQPLPPDLPDEGPDDWPDAPLPDPREDLTAGDRLFLLSMVLLGCCVAALAFIGLLDTLAYVEPLLKGLLP